MSGSDVRLGKPFVLTAALAISVGQLGVNMYMPALPVIADDLRVSASVMAQTVSVYLASFAAAILLAGPYVDAYGRRAAMLHGLAVYAVGTAVCAGATHVSWLFCGRFLQALGAGMPPVAGRAMVRDGFSGEESAHLMGYLTAAMAITPAIAPVLGGIVVQLAGWHSVFWVLLAFCAIVMTIGAILFPETLPFERRTPIRVGSVARTYISLLTDRSFMWPAAMVAACFLGVGAYITAGPFVFIHVFGLTPAQFGLANLVNVLAYLAGTVAARFLSRKWSGRRLLRASAALALVSGLALCLPSALGLVRPSFALAGLALFFASFGMIFPKGNSGDPML